MPTELLEDLFVALFCIYKKDFEILVFEPCKYEVFSPFPEGLPIQEQYDFLHTLLWIGFYKRFTVFIVNRIF